MSALGTLLGFIRKELIQTLRDPKLRVIIFVLPMVQMTLFGVAISTEVKNIRLAAVYRADDVLSRRIVDHALGSGWFVAAKGSGLDPFDWIRSGKADAVLVAPPGGLSASAGRPGDGATARLQLLVNASNVLQAQAVENYMKAVVRLAVSEGGETAVSEPPLVLDARVLYNPSLRSAIFMVPGVMSMILCIITILLTSMSIAREKELGTFEMIIAAPVKTWEVMLGKTVPFILLGMIDVPLILGVAVLGFEVPMRGPLVYLALASFIFVCTTVGIGTAISTIAKNQQQAMLGSFIFLFLAVLLSGIMFPVDSMPLWMRAVATLDPLKYFVTLLRNIMLKGGHPEVFWQNLGVLLAMGAFTMGLGFSRFRHTLQ